MTLWRGTLGGQHPMHRVKHMLRCCSVALTLNDHCRHTNASKCSQGGRLQRISAMFSEFSESGRLPRTVEEDRVME